jgi:hypothetical protein
MPSLILSNQVYMTGQTPVYVAYVTDENGQPLKRNKIDFITVTHMVMREGLRNGLLTDSWFTVGDLENVSISSFCFYDTPISMDALVTDVKAKVQHPTGTPENQFFGQFTHYNFLYIPLRGSRYYPSIGQYRTVFRIKLMDEYVLDEDTGDVIEVIEGKTDLIIYDSYADTEWNDGSDNFIPILERETEDIYYGEDIVFKGEVYVKYKEPEYLLGAEGDPCDSVYDCPDGHRCVDGVCRDIINNTDKGKLLFANRSEGVNGIFPIHDQVQEVFMTVSNVSTSARLIERERLGTDILLTAIKEPIIDEDEDSDTFGEIIDYKVFDYNWTYNFPTNRLTLAGLYRFRFEFQTFRELVGDNDFTMPCVFDIDVNVI